VDLTNAYANEVAILAAAVGTWCLIAWMIYDRKVDYENAVLDRAPAAWIIMGSGGLKAEWWRLFMMSLLVWITWWMVSHPPPTSSADFFDPAQFNPGRNVIGLLVLSKAMAAFTDRWYRRKARLAVGIGVVRK
jgi:hypothetical protein